MDRGQFSNYMARLNVRLILSAPLEYLQSVVSALGTYWLPNATPLSFGGSKLLQILWGGLQLVLASIFLASPIIIALQLSLGKRSSVDCRASSILACTFFLAALWQLYSCAISGIVSVGTPRYRIPTDFLIVLAVALVLSAGAKTWTLQKTADTDHS